METKDLSEIKVELFCISCTNKLGVPTTFFSTFGEQKADGVWLCPKCGRGTRFLANLPKDLTPELAKQINDQESISTEELSQPNKSVWLLSHREAYA